MRILALTGIFSALGCVLIAPPARAQNLTLQGRLFDNNDAPLVEPSVDIRVKIFTANSDHCLLYETVVNKNLLLTKGMFSLDLDGSADGSVSHGYTLEEAISNLKPFTLAGPLCGGTPAVYTPGPTDTRKIAIEFVPSSGAPAEAIPELDLNPTAYAMEARTVGGFPTTSLLRVMGGGSTPGLAPELTAAEATELKALGGGSSTKYIQQPSTGGAQVPVRTANPTTLTPGTMWFDNSSGQNVLKYYDGTTVQSVGAGGGGGTPSGSAGGDLAGTYPSPTLGKIQSVPLSITSLLNGQFLRYNGTNWINAALTLADLPTIDLTKGGTGLSTAGAADQLIGMNAAGTAMEYKTLTAGSNITITPAANSLTISAAAGLSAVGSHTILSNATGSFAVPSANSLSYLLDTSFSANQGSILFRNTTGWTVLPPGTNGFVLQTQGMMADPIWAPSSGGGGSVTSVDVSAPGMTSSGAITGAGTVALSYSSQGMGTVLAAPVGSSGVPSFRSIVKADLRSTAGGNPELFNVADTCASGTALNFNSVSARFECTTTTLDSAQVATAIGYNPVNLAGDTMTGPLALPANGLTVGTNQLKITSSGVGIGTASPAEMLSVNGVIQSLAGGVRFPDGTLQTSAAVAGGVNNTILSAFPDAIACSYGTGMEYLYLSQLSSTYVYYSQNLAGTSTKPYIRYNMNGTYFDQGNFGGTLDCVSNAWSITQLYASGKALNLLKGPAGQWLQNGSDAYYNAGKVGLGTNAPRASLDLADRTDAIALPRGTTGQQPASPIAGMLRWNSSTPGLEVYNGSAWAALSTGGGSYLSSSGGTVSGNLTISSGGATISGGVNNNSGGITNAGNITGVGGSITGASAITLASGGTNQNLGLTASGSGAVNLSTGGGTSLSVLDSGGTTANFVTIKGAAAGSSPAIAAAGSDTNINLQLTPKGTGKVGIGVASPATKLDVNGDINVPSGNGLWWGYPAATSSVTGALNAITFGLANSTFISLKDNFQPTLAPDQKNTSNVPGANFTIAAGEPSATTADQDGGSLNVKSGIAHGTGSSQIQFSTAAAGATGTGARTPAARMTILGSGNVGIGSSAPGQLLTVAGAIESTSSGFKFPDGTVQSTAAGGTRLTVQAISANYSVAFADNGKLFKSAGALTFTLPDPAMAGAGFWVRLSGNGAGAQPKLTLIQSASGTINGFSRLAFQSRYAQSFFYTDGTEWFVDGGAIPIPSAGKRIFRTSQSFNGNMGGLSGADALCQTAATNGGIPGTFKAWLADGTGTPSSRMTQASVPYYGLSGDLKTGSTGIFANNWAGLTSILDRTVTLYNEYGIQMPQNNVWTNSDATGNNQGSTCNNWTSGTGSYSGGIGSAGDQYSWAYQTYGSCTQSLTIYCFEQ